ncbi:indole-3-glycerol phosphate synthase TrpC [Cerasicoccus arenae]|uniref:Indole-3-glycerol phosphate synthase n=1 Tax=Cerasicoccus arenae TaxID=424488 RepID=A0A8J3DFV5_9BACT|nr:indole-3-glycerol phosphate synthase TrpC [Cerasicoccus arenae]MBK1857445.1 indole-3-glycerol phosphate synthase TrpC [Cerasicoccus arenae]GHB95072.1 indole-3-glycerol phosphate synthase [Cerasicoccus arenae]
MDKLAEIMAHKREEIEHRIRPVRDSELNRLSQNQTGKSFAEALRARRGLAVIAEIKRRSPSAGQIAELPDATEQARKYQNAEVDCLSVLTDEKYFGGSLRDLWNVTDFLSDHRRDIPCLRKDFFVHPIQIVEAAEAGARCILIIVRALEDDEIDRLYDAAQAAGLDALFEVHTERELDRALEFGPRIVGVNNRDLSRFVTDLAISELIIPQMPDDVIPVSESGIFTPEDAARAHACGAQAILVGEALMREEDPTDLVKAFHQA